MASHAIGLSILESKNEAGKIASFVFSIIVALLVHWYVAWISYRLWFALGEKRRKRKDLPLLSIDAVKIKIMLSTRDFHSIWVWVDSFVALIVAWAFLSQCIQALWPETFDTQHISHNRWAAAIQWYKSTAESAAAIGPGFDAIHPATAALYAFGAILFWVYDRVVVLIAIAALWEKTGHRFLDSSATRRAEKRQQQVQQQPPVQTSQSHIAYVPNHMPPIAVPASSAISHSAYGMPPPQPVSVPAPSQIHFQRGVPDELGLGEFLSQYTAAPAQDMRQPMRIASAYPVAQQHQIDFWTQ